MATPAECGECPDVLEKFYLIALGFTLGEFGEKLIKV